MSDASSPSAPDFQRLRELAQRHHGLVTSRQLATSGVSAGRRRGCRSRGELVRLGRTSWLVDAALVDPPSTTTRILAAVADQGPGAYAMLRAAAHLHAIGGLPARLPVLDVGLPARCARHLPRRSGLGEVRLHQVQPRRLVVVDGIACTDRITTLRDLLCVLPCDDAVSMLDAELHDRRLGPPDLLQLRENLWRQRGCQAARRCLELANGRAESPLETRVRLRACEAGLPPEQLQYVIRDESGMFLARADLAWPSRRVLVEADGAAFHSQPGQRRSDRHRANAMVTAGGPWTVLHFDWHDAHAPGYVASVLRTALQGTGPGPTRAVRL